MPDNINEKIKEQYDHDNSGGSLNTNQSDFLDSESASGNSINTQWRNWAEGTGTSLNTRLFHKHGGSGSFNTRWKNWIAFGSTHSFNFDGSNDYLDCGNSTGIQFSGSFSVSFWFNTTDATASNEILVSKSNDGVNDGWLIKLNSSRKLEFGLNLGVITDSGSASNDGNWHHVVAVHESGVGNRLYKNGSLVASNSTGTNLSNHVPNLHIGNQDHSTPRAINSLIDEVAIWNAVLSASDVTSIYNNGKIVDLSKSASYGTDRTANLKLWLRCGDKVEPETSIARSDFYTDFDGGNEAVIVEQTFTTDNFALSFWINPDNVTGNKYLFDQNGGICRSVVIGYQDGYINFINDDNDAGNYYPTGTASDTQIPVSIGEWQHYVMMTDGTKVYGYRNGVEIINVTGKWGASGAEKFWIGQHEGSNNYEGKISNVGIYQTVLDAQTIKQFAKSRYTPMRDTRFSAVSFDGGDEYIDCGNDSSLQITGALSISSWIKTDNNSKYMFLVNKNDNTNVCYYSEIFNNGQLFFRIVSGGTNYSVGNTANTQIADGNWHHYCCVFEPSTALKIYIDGELKETNTTSIPATIDNDTVDLEIGRRGDNSNYFEGSMSSASVYNTAKSAEEIYAIYQQGITYDESSLSGLQGYWRMGDDTSKAFPTIADSSSNSNDGTMTAGQSTDIVQQMVAGYDMGAFESSSEELNGELFGDPSFELSGNNADGESTSYFSSVPSGVQFTNGQMIVTGSGNKVPRPFPNPFLEGGKTYKIVINTASYTSGKIRFGDSDYSPTTGYLIPSSIGDNVFYYSPTGDVYFSRMGIANAGSGTVFTLNSITIKEVLQSADLSDTYPAIIDVNEPVAQERVTNTDFNNTSGWSDGSGRWTIDTSAGTATHDGSANFSPYLSQSNIFDDANALYKMTITIDSCENFASAGIVKNGSVSSFSGGLGISSTGTHTVHFTNSTSGLSIWSNGIVTVISHVSIKKLLGNVGTMTQMLSSNLVYSSVLPDQSFLTGVNSAYNFIDLDGSDQYISVQDDSSLTVSTVLSVSTWINHDSTGGAQAYVTNWDYPNAGRSYRLYYTNGLKIELSAAGQSDTKNITASFTPVVGSWYHIAFTFDSGTVKAYINGESQTVTADAGMHTSLYSSNGVTLIGAVGNESTNATPMNGKIGQTSIFNKVLSSTEVGAIYNLTRHGNLLDSYSDNLLGYWAMSSLDSATGLSDSISTVYDRSGNSNHGTPQNADAGDLKSPPNAEPNGYAKGDTNRSTTTP